MHGSSGNCPVQSLLSQSTSFASMPRATAAQFPALGEPSWRCLRQVPGLDAGSLAERAGALSPAPVADRLAVRHCAG